MKKIISTLLGIILGLLVIVQVPASSAVDWRDDFIRDKAAEIMQKYDNKCFVIKPDDPSMENYIYAVLNDDSLSSNVTSVMNGDGAAIEEYKQKKRELNLMASFYYGYITTLDKNRHFVVTVLNPLNKDEILYMCVDGVEKQDALEEYLKAGATTQTTPETAGQIDGLASDHVYDLDLSAGHYKGGLGIPTGRYTLTWVANRGNVHSPLKINEIFGEDKTTVFNNFDFNTGTELEVSGGLIVHIHTDNADFSKVTQRVIESEVETVLPPGNYTAGTDFPEGTYFIMAYEGRGNIHSYEAGVNEIISTEPDEHSIYQYNYATFKVGDPLEVSGCTIKLVPAGD